MKAIELESLYHATNEKTLACWQENSDTGKRRDEYYDPQKHALAAGIQPALPQPVAALLRQLGQLTQHDPLADVLPEEGFHFTFLPLTLPLYPPNAPLPEKTRDLMKIWQPYKAKTIAIRRLRLVALPGQLLLAGTPDEPAVLMRHAFCEQILNSVWKEELLERHINTPLPAPFWHSTLLRYRAAFLPAALRQFFRERQALYFGEVTGALKLASINYNWTTCHPVAGEPLMS